MERTRFKKAIPQRPYNALDSNTVRDAHKRNLLLSLKRGFNMYDLYNRENLTILDKCDALSVLFSFGKLRIWGKASSSPLNFSIVLCSVLRIQGGLSVIEMLNQAAASGCTRGSACDQLSSVIGERFRIRLS